MAQLRAYANASKPNPSNVLDDDEHVLSRCNAVVEANVLPVLIDCSKGRVSSASSMTDKILLSLSKNQKTRGQLAQQGAVKLLLLHIEQRAAKPQQEGNVNIDAAHALARILISVDPSLVFPASGLPHISTAVRPLVNLLTPATTTGLSDQARDLLPSFEGLLALTNLASTLNTSVSRLIVRSAWDNIQDLLLSTNEMIRRASCELVCNLAATDACQAKFADGSPQARQRVHTLLGLADVDDLATRRAASGALAELTQHTPVVAAVLQVKRGMEIILTLCEDDDEGLVQRGVVCLANMLEQPDEVGEQAKAVFKAEGGLEQLQASLQQNNGGTGVLEREFEAIKSAADR